MFQRARSEPEPAAVPEPPAVEPAAAEPPAVEPEAAAPAEAEPAVDTEPAVEPEAAVAPEAAAEPEPADAAEPTVDPEPTAEASRGLSRRLAGVAVVAIVVAVTMTTVATLAPARASADQEFVASARLQGHRVPTGDEQELLVSAARKICDRRAYHATVAERRATALSPPELGAVEQAFGDDARGFTVLALDTYCAG